MQWINIKMNKVEISRQKKIFFFTVMCCVLTENGLGCIDINILNCVVINTR